MKIFWGNFRIFMEENETKQLSSHPSHFVSSEEPITFTRPHSKLNGEGIQFHFFMFNVFNRFLFVLEAFKRALRWAMWYQHLFLNDLIPLFEEKWNGKMAIPSWSYIKQPFYLTLLCTKPLLNIYKLSLFFLAINTNANKNIFETTVFISWFSFKLHAARPS